MPQIQPIDIIAPGSFGLNTERGETLLRPQWATTALNAVINRSGRIGARKGWQQITSTPIAGTPTIDVLFEQLTTAGDADIISTAGNKIFVGTSDYTIAANDITSTTAPTANHWKFVNLSGKAYGVQRGHKPISRASGQDFADMVFTVDEGFNPPNNGNDILAAFGRLWFVDGDQQTIRYSALQGPELHTLEDGGGIIDMTSVWTTGTDVVVAIYALGANLIVFGRNHIVLWADKRGTELGLDPASLEVVDTIEGTGCIARDSVAATGEGDLVYLSRHGLQSLGRVIQQKSNPIVSLTKNIRTDFQAAILEQSRGDVNFDQVRGVYSQEEGLYILNMPGTGQMFVLDTTHPFQDDDGQPAVPVTIWEVGGGIGGLTADKDGRVLFGSAGVAGRYAAAQDNGATYTFDFFTGWLDFDQLNHRIKMLKEIVGSIVAGQGSVTFQWEFDFSGKINTRSIAFVTEAAAQFNLLGVGLNRAEFGLGEFSGGTKQNRVTVPAFGEGQFIRIGVTAVINGFELVVQQTSLSPKIGRMVT